MLAVILVRGVGLSVPDATAVLSKGSVKRCNVYRRLKGCPIAMSEAIDLLRDAAREDDSDAA